MNSQLKIKLAPTPETDDATLIALDIECGGKFEAVHVQVSKRLERERNEWKAKYIQQNKDLGCEMMDPNGTIWDYAKKVQTDLASMTEQRDRLAEALRKLADCDWVITPHDRMDAVREIARKALQSLNQPTKP